MSDNDVVKALEYCAEGGYCGDCGYDIKSAKCIAKIMKDSIDLIIRQKAEIERLNYESLQMVASIKNLRAEAVKEFAERLKETKFKHGNDFMVYADNIDTLVKEMVGDGK